ncbi:MAG: 23S rRNA (guanosine(2251)-2'-O)-methyltransferase RlmB [Chlamydiae bacterium CG10_big_fil_rev_8_21_14_0_10_42_34]|nr:MAG: 23S rRNA (guanosine(2251)-2'-O)-methyltransferase RlmB [Chlamydiae bacterium CG10_big_fil_rev_8_21_14_0_10_42_34]
MGSHAIDELLRFAPEKIVKVYTVASKDSPVLKLCEKEKIPITFVKMDQLTKMVDSDSHQGLVAQIKPRKYLDVKEFLKQAEENSLVLMLDQIFDPQNFGALIRSAECFGVSAVVWSKNRGADLTPVAAKTSCGASELIPLIRISNLATAVDQFKDGGFEVVASLLEPTSESAFGFSYSSKTLLIMGSEGEGIQPLLQKKADRSIYLPMKGKVASLNVAQAASALLALWSFGPR